MSVKMPAPCLTGTGNCFSHFFFCLPVGHRDFVIVNVLDVAYVNPCWERYWMDDGDFDSRDDFC